MASSDWSRHAAKYVKPAMKKAMAQARKTWTGGKTVFSAAEKKRLSKLRSDRDKINSTIKKMKQGKKYK